MDYRTKDLVDFMGFKIPKYLTNWQDSTGLLLAACLVLMLGMEPILYCVTSLESVGRELTETCTESEPLRFSYSVMSSITMLLYFSLLIDLSVFSTRISAFALMCLRVISEVGLYLGAVAFLVVTFASAISSLDQDVDEFAGIPIASMSLLKIAFSMVDETRFDAFEGNWALFSAVVVYIVGTTVFLMNLLIAQLVCAYQATFQDMLGYARLNRGQIVAEVMPTVPKRRWQNFVDSLRLDISVEFGEGDLGVPGGLQIFEPASANLTTVDMIKRYGGSTSPAAQWPEETHGEDEEDKFDRIEKFIERAMKRKITRKG